MKLSKAWCGLFASVGAGVGLTAYLAKKGSELCESATTNVVNSILDASLNLSNRTTTFFVERYPYPIHISIGDLSFNLRQALTQNLIETLEDLPEGASVVSKNFIWLQGLIILLSCGGLAALGIYSYKRYKALEELIKLKLESIDLESNSDLNRYRLSIN